MNGDNMNEFEHAFIFVKEELSKANHFNTNLNKRRLSIVVLIIPKEFINGYVV